MLCGDGGDEEHGNKADGSRYIAHIPFGQGFGHGPQADANKKGYGVVPYPEST